MPAASQLQNVPGKEPPDVDDAPASARNVIILMPRMMMLSSRCISNLNFSWKQNICSLIWVHIVCNIGYLST